jgi:hypothetical protein
MLTRDFKLKINVIGKYFELQIYPTKPPVASPTSCEYPLKG